MPQRTHVMLDGLQDPRLGRELSAAWMRAGFENAVDVAGQAGWIAKAQKAEAGDEGQADVPVPPIDESDMVLAAGIARAFGVELRDRVGTTFKADNELPALREQITREYRARFFQSLVFGLPALVIHYLGPALASGGGQSASNMAFPWLLEMVLVGWSLWIAALPVLWQGGWSLIHLRATADLLMTAVILGAFIPSAVGVVSLLFTDSPWFGVPVNSDGQSVAYRGPAFHIAIMAVMVVAFQRWQLHRHAGALSGRGNRMLPGFGGVIAVWLVTMIAATALAGWHIGLCVGLLLPPMLSAGAVNRWSPGWSFALPVLAFAPVFLLGPRSFPAAASMRFEIAAGFAWMMSIVMMAGWRKMEEPQSAPAV